MTDQTNKPPEVLQCSVVKLYWIMLPDNIALGVNNVIREH